MLNRKKKEKRKLLLLGFEPMALSFNAVDRDSIIFEYSLKLSLCIR
jgi:hypothetical protein